MQVVRFTLITIFGVGSLNTRYEVNRTYVLCNAVDKCPPKKIYNKVDVIILYFRPIIVAPDKLKYNIYL